jgi:Zn finger protein HypA/HybF involved in hydrogenase expression
VDAFIASHIDAHICTYLRLGEHIIYLDTARRTNQLPGERGVMVRADMERLGALIGHTPETAGKYVKEMAENSFLLREERTIYHKDTGKFETHVYIGLGEDPYLAGRSCRNLAPLQKQPKKQTECPECGGTNVEVTTETTTTITCKDPTCGHVHTHTDTDPPAPERQFKRPSYLTLLESLPDPLPPDDGEPVYVPTAPSPFMTDDELEAIRSRLSDSTSDTDTNLAIIDNLIDTRAALRTCPWPPKKPSEIEQARIRRRIVFGYDVDENLNPVVPFASREESRDRRLPHGRPPSAHCVDCGQLVSNGQVNTGLPPAVFGPPARDWKLRCPPCFAKHVAVNPGKMPDGP